MTETYGPSTRQSDAAVLLDDGRTLVRVCLKHKIVAGNPLLELKLTSELSRGLPLGQLTTMEEESDRERGRRETATERSRRSFIALDDSQWGHK